MSSENFDELACTYAALILHDTGLSITADNISSILKASNVTVEPYWPSLLATFLNKEGVANLLSNLGGSSSSAPAGGAAPASSGSSAPAKEATPPASSSSEGDMGLDLFG